MGWTFLFSLAATCVISCGTFPGRDKQEPTQRTCCPKESGLQLEY